MSNTATITAVRDISTIEFHDWPLRELRNVQGQRESRFQVVFKQSVREEIQRHGLETPDVEVCGVLVGRCVRDLHGPYLLVEHCIRGNGARNKSTAVTFTTDAWQHIHETMDRQHPDETIVGWYHTHPGFGIFLSEMDLFICDHFFNLLWQSAFVFDPHSGEEGNFIWRSGRPDPDAVLTETEEPPSPTTELTAEVPEGDLIQQIAELKHRVHQLEQRLILLAMVFLFAVGFGAMWKLGYLSDAQPAPTTQPTTQATTPQ
jgi:proteasome lid subunit RPN8/RPN11